MKRMTGWIVTGLLLAVARPMPAQQSSSDVYLEKLFDGLHLIKGGRGANGGVCIGDNGVLVIRRLRLLHRQGAMRCPSAEGGGLDRAAFGHSKMLQSSDHRVGGGPRDGGDQ